MSFFPPSFNPRDDVVAMLDLAELDTPDGPVRFITGTDARFIDTSGNSWIGSQLIKVSGLQSAIDGIAPAGSLTLSFFQDPDAASLIQQVKELGVDYIAGRPIRFYFQPIQSQAEFYKPTLAPIRWMQRTMRTLTFSAGGAQDRSITLSFEAWGENRRAARRIILNTEGHKALIGETNVSLIFMPTTNDPPMKMFG